MASASKPSGPPAYACDKKFVLNNGQKMPAVGLGTYRIRNREMIMSVVDHALECGYRMFDTAAVYGNESYLKDAFKTLLPKHGLEREDIFVTTKISPMNQGGEDSTNKAYQDSLDNLGLEYVDLYLIHFPGSAKIKSNDPKNETMRNTTWAAMAEIYDSGRVNAIGVSNFTVKHLNSLLAKNHGVIPAVNQVEWHPYYHQKDLLDYCRKNEIVLQAYCSFGGTSTFNYSLMEHSTVKRIAAKMEVSPAQVLLQWSVQQDIAVIPKSTNPDRIKQNIQLNFTIAPEDMKALDALGSTNEKYAWDPSEVA